MEGGRAGRSSSRYGGASSSVFTGPVRKWNKKWIQLPPTTNHNNNNNPKQQSSSSNNNNNNNQDSHLLFYKWAPISTNNTNNGTDDDDDNDDNEDEPPRRKFKYIPVAVLEELNNEAAEVQTDESKPMDTDSHAPAEPSLQTEKPDINDLPVEENQVSENSHVEREDLHKSTSGLSLNLNARDGDDDDEESEEAKDQTNDDQ